MKYAALVKAIQTASAQFLGQGYHGSPEHVEVVNGVCETPRIRNQALPRCLWHAIRHKHTLISKDRALPFFKAHGLKSEW
jgi:hypothetical protein